MTIPHEIRVTRSGPPLPAGVLRCSLAGHWATREHSLDVRRLDETVLIHCVAGGGWCRVAGRRHAVGPGDLFCCPPGVAHGYGCGAGGWEIHWLHAEGAAAARLCELAGFTAAHPVRALGPDPAVVGGLTRLRDTLSGSGPTVAWDASGHLYALLLTLVKSARRGAGGPDLAGLITDDCACLDDLVARSGYSKYHFCRRFKAQTGSSPWQYVTARKLERARELLLATRLTVKEIATQLGFNTPDYFARLFARHTGVTPTQYRGG